jgi:hypothetical protein
LGWLRNSQAAVAGIVAREADGKRSRPEMAPQRLEKIESAPGNGMGSEASNLQDLVRGRAADRARLRPTSRDSYDVSTLQKKVPNDLKSLDAELKSAPRFPKRTPGPSACEAPTGRLEREGSWDRHHGFAALVPSRDFSPRTHNPTRGRKYTCLQNLENSRNGKILARVPTQSQTRPQWWSSSPPQHLTEPSPSR